MRCLVISLLSWVAHQLVCVVAFKEISLPCAKGCEAVGNCNREFGTCECPFGRTGPSRHAERGVPMQGVSDRCHTGLHGRQQADAHRMPGRPHALAPCPSHEAALMLCCSNCYIGSPIRRTFLVIQPCNRPHHLPPRTRRALAACEVHALVFSLPVAAGGGGTLQPPAGTMAPRARSARWSLPFLPPPLACSPPA